MPTWLVLTKPKGDDCLGGFERRIMSCNESRRSCSWRSWRVVARRDSRSSAFLGNSASLLPSEGENSARFLAQEIGETLFGFMMRNVDDLDVNASLGAMGVDSLVSIELRNWMRQRIGVDLTVLDIIGSGNLVELGGKTVEKLRERVAGA